jgi:hypothetical protein
MEASKTAYFAKSKDFESINPDTPIRRRVKQGIPEEFQAAQSAPLLLLYAVQPICLYPILLCQFSVCYYTQQDECISQTE